MAAVGWAHGAAGSALGWTTSIGGSVGGWKACAVGRAGAAAALALSPMSGGAATGAEAATAGGMQPLEERKAARLTNVSAASETCVPVGAAPVCAAFGLSARARLAGGLSSSAAASAAVVTAAATAAGRGRTKPEARGVEGAAAADINDLKVLVPSSSPKPRVTRVTIRVESQ